MSQDHFSEFVGKKFIGFSVVATLVVWLFFTYMLTPFVPTESMPWVYILSGFTATPISGVFFISIYMFWLVAMEQRKARQSE